MTASVTPVPVAIRAAVVGDGPFVAAVFGAARAEMTYLPVLHTAADHVLFFSAYVAGEGHWVEVAVEVAAAASTPEASGGEAVVAFCGVHGGTLDHLYVTPQWQGRGIGSALIERAQAAHPGGLSLWVFEENARAQALYTRAGFVEQYRTDGSDNEEQVPDVRMHWPGAPAAAAAAAP
jgi:ribosomal protein S18 acetylase RimI-like enzyme